MENQDFEKQIERCQALLDALSPEEGLDRVHAIISSL